MILEGTLHCSFPHGAIETLHFAGTSLSCAMGGFDSDIEGYFTLPNKEVLGACDYLARRSGDELLLIFARNKMILGYFVGKTPAGFDAEVTGQGNFSFVH